MGWVKAWAVGTIVLGVAHVAGGAVLFESAIRTKTGQGGGTSVSGGATKQWLGARFHLSQDAAVTSVGGELVQFNGNALFAAIVRLDGPTSLPHGSPFDAQELLAETTFSAPAPSALVNVPLAVSLAPGDYGLVFGSGMFGASGEGAMPSETNLSNSSYFYWYDPTGQGHPVWNQGTFPPAYFVVNGTVPEPGAIGFFGAVGVLCVRRRGRRANRTDVLWDL
jgi:hypothetical protein